MIGQMGLYNLLGESDGRFSSPIPQFDARKLSAFNLVVESALCNTKYCCDILNCQEFIHFCSLHRKYTTYLNAENRTNSTFCLLGGNL